jgi:hypothetical protein
VGFAPIATGVYEVMNATHKYIEHSDRGFCDFCSEGPPTMIWTLPPGQRVSTGVMDKATGKMVHTSQDGDGLWSTCPPCHEDILKYKSAKVKPSALRKFTASVQSRTRLEERHADLLKKEGVKKAVRDHQKSLFGRLLPQLSLMGPVPPDAKPGRFIAQGDEKMVEATRAMRARMHEDWAKQHPGETQAPKSKVTKLPDLPKVIGPDSPDGQARAVAPRRWV